MSNDGSRHHRRVIFGRALERFMHEQQITSQSEFARRLKEADYPKAMTSRTINDWINGRSEPVDPKVLTDCLERAYDVTPDQWVYLSVALVFPHRYEELVGS